MAITNFIPTVWSENLLTALDKKYIGVANCSRDYEGEIKNQGSVVKICGVGAITVSDYTKDTDMSAPQALDDTVTELVIDQAKFFNFQIDDVEKTQCTPKLMDAAMKSAAAAVADQADKYVYSLYEGAANSIFHSDLYDGTLVDSILSARQILYENNVSDSTEVVLEVSPTVASVILKEKLALGDNEVLDNGYLGSIAGCKIFVSNNIVRTTSDMGDVKYKCLMRTTRAIAFAEQLSEIEAYRPEKRFADAIKGLHLYGAKVVYPDEMVTLDVCIPA
ncbi:MAG: P22 coat protein - protein 5 domain protein [Clostridia bacterium]|nr:P22 coat protein - protein 5 domain protein [Clostridia bacterium]